MMREGTEIDEALRRAVREALLRHRSSATRSLSGATARS
jgi:hypothetical protein